MTGEEEELRRRITALEHKVDRHMELLTAAGRSDADLLNRLTLLARSVSDGQVATADALELIARQFNEVSDFVTRLCDPESQPNEGEPNGDRASTL